MPPAKLGLIYSHTGLAKFIDVCGPANTAELFFVGRNVDSERAREMGLVNEVVEPVALDERVLDLASEIASNAPLSLAGNKRCSASCARCGCPRSWSASWSSCASRASPPRTSARACARSRRSASRSGAAASPVGCR